MTYLGEMTRTTILKVAGLALLAAVAVYTQYRPGKPMPRPEARAEAVTDASRISSGVGVATKEAVQYADGMAPWQQEPQEPFELTGKDTPQDIISTLIDAPFNQAPGETISEKNNWRTVAYPPEYCDPPSYSRIFRRKGPGLEISLYAYTAPSLTEANEFIMAGELKIFREIEQAEALDLLKNAGFEAKPTEKHLSSPGSKNWTDVMEITKGPLSGLLYFEPHGSARALKIKLEHKDSGAYSYRGPTVEQYTQFYKYGNKLSADLEQQGAEKILGADWPQIKTMLEVSSTSVPAETLLAARNSAIMNRHDGDAGAPFRVLETRLVDSLFRAMNGVLWKSESPPKELELLRMNGIPFELKHFIEDYYAPKDNSVFKVYKEYPGTYWGQYAFINELESGCSEDSYKQLPLKVISEGEDFLRKHPDSRLLTRALFLMGKAHESIYSNGLSQGASEKGEKHRLAAIKYFTELLTRPDGKVYEEHLRYILPKLRTKGSAYCAFFINCNPC